MNEDPTKKGSPKGQRKGRQSAWSHTIEIDGDVAQEHDVLPLPKNHLRQGKLYDDFCVLNQEFLKYLWNLKLSISEHRILLFLLSFMDKDNKIIIDSEMIEYHLGINSTNVNKYIKKLEKHKVIYKRNLGYRKGAEVLLNFDIITPHMAFKNRNNYENVNSHKTLMRKNLPYIRQKNIDGTIDLINSDTGEVYYSEKSLPENRDLDNNDLP